MQHEVWCRDHRPPLDDTQAWTPCMGSPDAHVPGSDPGGRPTEAWLTKDGQDTVVDLAHDESRSIPVQAFGEFGLQCVLLAIKGGAVLKWPDPPPVPGQA